MLIARFRVELPESMHRNLAALIVAVFVGSGADAVAEDLVWQLRLQNGRPADCWLGFTRAGQGAGNQPFLAADTRSAKGDWNACVVLPKGLLKVNQNHEPARRTLARPGHRPGGRNTKGKSHRVARYPDRPRLAIPTGHTQSRTAISAAALPI